MAISNECSQPPLVLGVSGSRRGRNSSQSWWSKDAHHACPATRFWGSGSDTVLVSAPVKTEGCELVSPGVAQSLTACAFLHWQFSGKSLLPNFITWIKNEGPEWGFLWFPCALFSVSLLEVSEWKREWTDTWRKGQRWGYQCNAIWGTSKGIPFKPGSRTAPSFSVATSTEHWKPVGFVL